MGTAVTAGTVAEKEIGTRTAKEEEKKSTATVQKKKVSMNTTITAVTKAKGRRGSSPRVRTVVKLTMYSTCKTLRVTIYKLNVHIYTCTSYNYKLVHMYYSNSTIYQLPARLVVDLI